MSKKSLGFSKAIKLPNEKRKNTQERRAQNVGEAKKHSERHFTQLVKDAESSEVLRDDPELVNFLEPLGVAVCPCSVRCCLTVFVIALVATGFDQTA